MFDNSVIKLINLLNDLWKCNDLWQQSLLWKISVEEVTSLLYVFKLATTQLRIDIPVLVVTADNLGFHIEEII